MEGAVGGVMVLDPGQEISVVGVQDPVAEHRREIGEHRPEGESRIRPAPGSRHGVGEEVHPGSVPGSAPRTKTL